MKVYISKSNQANPDDIINLRNLLKEDTISEYKGGQYNMIELMDNIEKFYLVPPAQEVKDNIRIGRGICTELNHALKHLAVPCFMFCNNQLYPIKDYELIEVDWQLNWAVIITE